MPKFNEETFNNWRKPPSDSEEAKLSNSLKLVKEAINSHPLLSKKNIDIFAQGSYANDTNVRLNSDIDINVRLSDTIYYQIPDGKTKDQYGYTDSNYTFEEFKSSVIEALKNKFGVNYVTRNDKCVTIAESKTWVTTDVVPTFKYNRHNTNVVVGAKFRSDAGRMIECFPLQHIENGKLKNAGTQKRFKRTTRLFRRIRYKMIEDNVPISDNITSFLLECLVWNVPDNVFNDNDTWTEIVKQSIISLYNNTKESGKCEKWGEVSELLYLFHGNRKWSSNDVKDYLVQMWNYLDFK